MRGCVMRTDNGNRARDGNADGQTSRCVRPTRANFACVMAVGRWRGAGCEIFNTKGHKALLRGLYRITKFFEFLWARFEITSAAAVKASGGFPPPAVAHRPGTPPDPTGAFDCNPKNFFSLRWLHYSN